MRQGPPPNNSPALRGLPVSLDAERFVLGSILLNESLYSQAANSLNPESFSLEKHARIFKRMGEIHSRNEHIDRATVANELMRWGELESCDGLSYLCSLDEGLPMMPHIDSYINIVKEKSALRRIVLIGQRTIKLATSQEQTPSQVLGGLNRAISKLQLAYDPEPPMRTPLEIMRAHEGGVTGFIQQGIKMGLPTGFPQLDEKIMGLQKGGYYIFAGVPKSGKSSMVKDICLNLAAADHPGVVFSVEMSKEQLVQRMLCSHARVDANKVRTGYLAVSDWPHLTAAAGRSTTGAGASSRGWRRTASRLSSSAAAA